MDPRRQDEENCLRQNYDWWTAEAALEKAKNTEKRAKERGQLGYRRVQLLIKYRKGKKGNRLTNQCNIKGLSLTFYVMAGFGATHRRSIRCCWQSKLVTLLPSEPVTHKQDSVRLKSRWHSSQPQTALNPTQHFKSRPDPGLRLLALQLHSGKERFRKGTDVPFELSLLSKPYNTLCMQSAITKRMCR